MPSPSSAELILAVRFSPISKVKELLAQGADVNGKDSIGNTALIYAAGMEGHMEVARLLLDKGARIDDTNNWGDTALMRAISWDNTAEMVQFLINRGAALDIKNKGGHTAESIAASKGRLTVVRMIREAAEIQRKIAEEKARLEEAKKLAADRQGQLKKIKSPPCRPK